MGHPVSPMADETEKASYSSVLLCHPVGHYVNLKHSKVQRSGRKKKIASEKKPENKLGFSPPNLRIIATNSEWLILFPTSMSPRTYWGHFADSKLCVLMGTASIYPTCAQFAEY